jgi:hypothetical protein
MESLDTFLSTKNGGNCFCWFAI